MILFNFQRNKQIEKYRILGGILLDVQKKQRYSPIYEDLLLHHFKIWQAV